VAKVVPESCQRTDGIKAWLETKEERENREFKKAQTMREKEEEMLIKDEERNARNAGRQRMNEMRKLDKLKKKQDSEVVDPQVIDDSHTNTISKFTNTISKTQKF
jgi:hypothetical protein